MRSIKTIAIIFLFIAVSAPLFLSAFFLGGRILIRHTMLENLETQQLTTVQIPEDSFKWYKINREIVIEGKMFDVKSIKLVGGIYHVTGLYDDDETDLNEEMNKFHKKSNEQPSGSNLIFQVCLGLECDEKDLCQFHCILPDEITIQNSLHSTIFKSQHYLTTISPPPEA